MVVVVVVLVVVVLRCLFRPRPPRLPPLGPDRGRSAASVSAGSPSALSASPPVIALFTGAALVTSLQAVWGGLGVRGVMLLLNGFGFALRCAYGVLTDTGRGR